MSSKLTIKSEMIVPDVVYPLDESISIKYFVVVFVGSSCRILYSSFSFEVCFDLISMFKSLHPSNDYHILKSITNLQKIS